MRELGKHAGKLDKRIEESSLFGSGQSCSDQDKAACFGSLGN